MSLHGDFICINVQKKKCLKYSGSTLDFPHEWDSSSCTWVIRSDSTLKTKFNEKFVFVLTGDISPATRKLYDFQEFFQGS